MSEDVVTPIRARGYVSQATTDPTGWWMDLTNEHVPALRFPFAVPVYREMRKDPQVASILRAVTLPILRTQWRVDPQNARPEVVDLVAGDLGLPVIGQPARPAGRHKGHFSWTEHLRLALTCLPYGAAYFEQEAEIRDGLAHLHRLGYRPIETFPEPPRVARDGGLVSIQQSGLSGDGPVTIPVDRLVAYVHQREGANWLGESVLRPAYQPYLLRDRLVRIDTIKNDRFGVGTPTYESGRPDGADMEAGSELMQQMRSGAEAGIAIPQGAKASIVVPMGSIPQTLESIEYHDRKIAGTVLGHWMNLGQQTGTGSYALGAVQINEFSESLETVVNDLEDVANAHIVEDLVDWNWGPDEPAPRLVADQISERWTAQMLKLLVDAGLLFPDRKTEESIRQDIGLPAKDQQGAVA